MLFDSHTNPKTKERALLLMRFYWLDGLYDIGKSLLVPYFERFANYWDIGYDVVPAENRESVS